MENDTTTELKFNVKVEVPPGKEPVLVVFVHNPTSLAVRMVANLTPDQLQNLKDEINHTFEVVYGTKH